MSEDDIEPYNEMSLEEDPLIQLRRSAGMKDEGIGRAAGEIAGTVAGGFTPVPLIAAPALGYAGGELGDWAEKKIRVHGDEHAKDYEDEEVDEGAFADALRHLGGLGGAALGKKLHPKGVKGGHLMGKAIGDTAGQYIDNKVDKFFNRAPAAKPDTSRPRPAPAQEKPVAPASEKPAPAATAAKSEHPEAVRSRQRRQAASAAKQASTKTVTSESGNWLEGQYGHSGKMKPVTGGDADTIARLKFLSGITK
jgi:phage tail tape-measure protein